MIGCVQFVVLSTLAMFFYPGGTYSDESTSGYSFPQNFFSDLGRTAAHNGDSNTASMVLFVMALSLVGLTLVLFFLAVPQHFASSHRTKRLSAIGSVVGVISGISYIGIAAVPADINLMVHGYFVLTAFGALLLVVVCYSTAILRSQVYPRTYAFVHFASAVILALYLVLLFSGPDVETTSDVVTTSDVTIQAVGQKVVVYAR